MTEDFPRGAPSAGSILFGPYCINVIGNVKWNIVKLPTTDNWKPSINLVLNFLSSYTLHIFPSNLSPLPSSSSSKPCPFVCGWLKEFYQIQYQKKKKKKSNKGEAYFFHLNMLLISL